MRVQRGLSGQTDATAPRASGDRRFVTGHLRLVRGNQVDSGMDRHLEAAPRACVVWLLGVHLLRRAARGKYGKEFISFLLAVSKDVLTEMSAPVRRCGCIDAPGTPSAVSQLPLAAFRGCLLRPPAAPRPDSA